MLELLHKYTHRIHMSRRGRPPSFDRSVALERAMEVFWEKGYEGAQLVDLTKAMGINPSFYAAFGSKQDAFCEAVDLYIRLVGSKSAQALNGAKTTRDGLRAMLEATINVATSNKAGGCLLVLGVVNNFAENNNAWSHLRKTRRDTLALIRARLQRGIAEGDLPGRRRRQRTCAVFPRADPDYFVSGSRWGIASVT